MLTMTIGLLLMAAGRSTRFKRTSHGIHKLVYPHNGSTLLEMTYQSACKAIPENDICIITNAFEPEVCELANQLTHSTLTIHSNGLGESIAQGIAFKRDWQGALILHGDLPYIQPESIQAIYTALQQHPIVRPSYDGKLGHPVGFQHYLFPSLMRLTGDQGAKAIMQNTTLTLIPLNDPGTIQDIDTLQDLEKFISL